MQKLYLVTGATGHLGTCLTAELLRRGEHVRVLVRPGRSALVPQGAEASKATWPAGRPSPPFLTGQALTA